MSIQSTTNMRRPDAIRSTCIKFIAELAGSADNVQRIRAAFQQVGASRLSEVPDNKLPALVALFDRAFINWQPRTRRAPWFAYEAESATIYKGGTALCVLKKPSPDAVRFARKAVDLMNRQ